MSKDPEQIRADIAATRGNLSSDVNALTDSVKPANVAKRQLDKVRGAAVSTKERVMGAAPDLGSAKDGAAAKADHVKAGVGDAASGVGHAVTSSPELVRTKTAGNPLAAGLIAFGAGWLTASLIPATQRERQAAAKVKQNAEPLKQKVSDTAKDVAGDLREPVQQAVESVKQTASEAVDQTKQEGTSAAQRVKGDAQDAASTVQESRS
jgi:gas vesicle protein